MAATLAAPKTDTERIVLRGVSWSVYEALLRDLADQHVYMTYSGGNLELMSPSRRHETWKKRLGSLVENLAVELAIPMAPCGSTTFKREDLAKGLEPDECYYVQHEAAVRGDNEIDLSIAPPPDLVIEVDITYRALGREPIYAALGVPELWRFDGERIEFLALAADRSYQPLPRSLAFPMLSLSDLQRFVQMFRDGDKDDTSILRAFREWSGKRCRADKAEPRPWRRASEARGPSRGAIAPRALAGQSPPAAAVGCTPATRTSSS